MPPRKAPKGADLVEPQQQVQDADPPVLDPATAVDPIPPVALTDEATVPPVIPIRPPVDPEARRAAREAILRGEAPPVSDTATLRVALEQAEQARAAAIVALGQAEAALAAERERADKAEQTINAALGLGDDTQLVEWLAEIEHNQWMGWARTIIDTESISQDRRRRWTALFIAYADLPEKTKDQDRVHARAVLEAIRGRKP